MNVRFVALAGAMLLAVPFASTAATCTGNCGTLGADGVVTLSPNGGTYQYVSTFQGQNGAGQIAGYGGTNGSSLESEAFYAAAGAKVDFYFNYITSDGAGYADYAFSQLQTSDGTLVANIFTARTKPSGSIVPGQDLPGVTAILNPASVPIIPGGPAWSPIGGSSGSCYSAGCGYTGWIKSTYTIATAGSYRLNFGVTNYLDTAYDSGLAFDGILVGGSTLGDGSSAGNPLLPIDLTPQGGFQFVFTPTPNQMVFIDPLVATGYDYVLGAGSPLISKALFPTIAGDADGYDVFALSDLSTALFSGVLGGQTIDFTSLAAYAGGIGGFALRGINVGANLDPTNTTAFVTGLTFASAGQVSITQTPVSTLVGGAVPEPASWALMLAGFGLTGVIARRRARVAVTV